MTGRLATLLSDAPGAAEPAFLVGLDDAKAPVDEHDAHDRDAEPLRRLELLDVHEEAAVA